MNEHLAQGGHVYGNVKGQLGAIVPFCISLWNIIRFCSSLPRFKVRKMNWAGLFFFWVHICKQGGLSLLGWSTESQEMMMRGGCQRNCFQMCPHTAVFTRRTAKWTFITMNLHHTASTQVGNNTLQAHFKHNDINVLNMLLCLCNMSPEVFSCSLSSWSFTFRLWQHKYSFVQAVKWLMCLEKMFICRHFSAFSALLLRLLRGLWQGVVLYNQTTVHACYFLNNRCYMSEIDFLFLV